MCSRARSASSQQASGQVVDAVEPVVFEYVQRGALARARTPTDDEPHLYPIALATVLHIHDDLVQAVVVGCLAQTLAYLLHGRACWRSGAAARGARRWPLPGPAGRTAGRPGRHRWRRSPPAFPGAARHSRGVAADHAAVRNGDAIAEAGRAQLSRAIRLSKMVWESRSGKVLGDHLGDLLQDALLHRPGRSPGTSGGQDVFESDHNERQRVTAPWVWSSCFSLCLIS